MPESAPEIPIEAFTVFADGLDHPECCAFDRQGYLWAGGEAGQVYRISPIGGVDEVTKVGGFCGGLAFSLVDELFVCNPAHGVVLVYPSGKWSVFADSAAGKKLIEPNYLLFDCRGNLYLSDSGVWRGNIGRVVRFDPSGASLELASGFSYANGLALTENEEWLFVAETDTNSIYRIQLLDGGTAAGPPERIATVAHAPDGLGLDIDGNLYVTCYGSHQLFRVTPRRELIMVAHDPTGIVLGAPTNLTFAGAEWRDIYVANLGRTTIVRSTVPRPGLPPVNLRTNSV